MTAADAALFQSLADAVNAEAFALTGARDTCVLSAHALHNVLRHFSKGCQIAACLEKVQMVVSHNQQDVSRGVIATPNMTMTQTNMHFCYYPMADAIEGHIKHVSSNGQKTNTYRFGFRWKDGAQSDINDDFVIVTDAKQLSRLPHFGTAAANLPELKEIATNWSRVHRSRTLKDQKTIAEKYDGPAAFEFVIELDNLYHDNLYAPRVHRQWPKAIVRYVDDALLAKRNNKSGPNTGWVDAVYVGCLSHDVLKVLAERFVRNGFPDDTEDDFLKAARAGFSAEELDYLMLLDLAGLTRRYEKYFEQKMQARMDA